MQQIQKTPLPLSFSNSMYEAICVPPTPEDLSLSRLEVENGVPQNAAFSARILNIVREHTSAERLYATNAEIATATVISPRLLKNKVRLGPHLSLYNNIRLRAEGTWLKYSREAAVFNTGGCPVLGFTGKEYFCVVHAGRDSMIDRKRIMTGEKSRRFESVIVAVVARFKKLGVSPEDISIHGFFGLHPQTFDHAFDDPTYGELNQRMATELNRRGREVIKQYDDGKHKLVLGELIRLQAAECGIPITSVEYTHKLPAKGQFASTKHPEERLRTSSNLVIITRLAA